MTDKGDNKTTSYKKPIIIATAVVLILSVIYFLYSLQFNEVDVYNPIISNQVSNQPNTPKKPSFLYNLPVDSFQVSESIIKPGESLGKILDQNGISARRVYELVEASKDVFNVKYVKADAKYTLFKSLDSTAALQYLIYEKSLTNYIVFDLRDTVKVWMAERKVTTQKRTAAGVINRSLSQTIDDLKLGQPLAHRIEDIYAWSINFFTLQKGDAFKVVYTEDFIDDSLKVNGSERILAATFTHQGRDFNAYSFITPEGWTEYYDEEGKSLRKSFLMAPLKSYRISSRFTRRRFHPVQKRWKAHKGTDFAAPKGTPIMTTASGTVIKVGYTSGNGNYVKVKHNSKYTTQYLHMSRFKKDIKVGTRVKQGDIIGYVGSTGLATGPHVCYRFWVNGVQQDPYKQKLPEAEPIKEEWKEDFLKEMLQWQKELNEI